MILPCFHSGTRFGSVRVSLIMTSVAPARAVSLAGRATANATRASSARRASTTGSSSFKSVSRADRVGVVSGATTRATRATARFFSTRFRVHGTTSACPARGNTFTHAANDDTDPPVVGKSSFDFDKEMMADMERLKADSPFAAEQAERAAAGIVKTESQMKMEALKDGVDTFLLYDFFVILFILSWLIVGVLYRLGYHQGLAYDEPFLGLWLILWPFLFQPLLGVHMLATLVSPIIGKLKDRGLVSKDTWT